MSEWEYICNGGPNGRSVFGTAKSLGSAIGGLEAMMKALGATIGQVQRADSVEEHGHPVETEEEAGQSPNLKDKNSTGKPTTKHDGVK